MSVVGAHRDRRSDRSLTAVYDVARDLRHGLSESDTRHQDPAWMEGMSVHRRGSGALKNMGKICGSSETGSLGCFAVSERFDLDRSSHPHVGCARFTELKFLVGFAGIDSIIDGADPRGRGLMMSSHARMVVDRSTRRPRCGTPIEIVSETERVGNA